MTFRTIVFFAAVLLLAAPAAAQDSLYTVSGVHVDATAQSSTEAMNAAIAQGRGKAFQVLYRRLTRQADWARQPALDAAALLRISRGYNIANERRSTTRYVADVTYMFNPEAVARTLRAAQIAFSQATAKRILVIPMSPGSIMGPGPRRWRPPSRAARCLHRLGGGRRRLAGGAEFRRRHLERCRGGGGEGTMSPRSDWCRRSMPTAR